MNNIRLTAITTLMTSAATMSAIPADPEPKRILQPDGTEITVIMRGDEYSHALYTPDGCRVEFDQSGMLQKVSSDTPLRGMRRSLSSDTRHRVRINNFPTTGHRKALVVLIEFSDQPFLSLEDPYDYYDRMLNEEGFTWDNGADGSVRDFYLASSDGKFDPEFTVIGPIRLQYSAKYYGEDYKTQDARMGEAVLEACLAIDDEVDFSEYDADGDGMVDSIFFFYSGYGQADYPQGNDFIWPHSANLEEAWGIHLELDGKIIGNYACSNEVRYSTIGEVVPTGIGTFVHEFGHVLGLADHYDVGYSLFSFGLGAWDTMAQGSYNNNMHTPPLFSAFERAELDWLEYGDLLEESAEGIVDLPWIGNGQAKGYRIDVPGYENEWFVIENRQQIGWDRYLPGHGMLIWHIDMIPERWLNNTVNTDALHQLVDIVEVDGIGSETTRDGDIMPGSYGVTTYTLTAWNESSVFCFDDVEEVGDDPETTIIRILAANSSFRPATPESVKVSDLSDDSFTFSWTPVENASWYRVSITVGDETVGDWMNRIFLTPEIVTLTDLTPETEYTVTITAGRGSVTSEPLKEIINTPELAFVKRCIDNISLTPSGSDTFTASWSEVSGADSYLISLCSIGRASDTHTEGYGFDDKSDGLPSLWTTTSNSYYAVDGFYGKSAPSLRMIKDGDRIEIAYPEMLLDELSFWGADNGSGNEFAVEIPDGDSWLTIGSVSLTKGGQIFTLPLDGVERVAISLVRKGGYALIDDIEIAGRSLTRTPVEPYYDVLTDEPVYKFVNLIPGEEYGLRITPMQNGIAAVQSPETRILLDMSGIDSFNEASAIPVAWYDAHGVRHNTPCDGFNIVVYSDGSRRKIMKIR
ncbi:MAG: M6 family metalloprotease domain-containing protein [Muribaculaceae bacterium]|nr:M6 family metalloprotease domain-containing protein [Muribaculaceae bacterium]